MSRGLTKEQKRKVYEELREMGFDDSETRTAIDQCGYNTRKCATWLAQRGEKKELFVGMDVWYYCAEDHAWIHANIVSITRALVALIFKGNDFKWLEKDSDLFTTDEDRPELEDSDSEGEDDVAEHMAEYTPPREDEIDYVVVFPEPTLGLELFSDEHGFGCVVGRCVSHYSMQNVARSSHIVEVNDTWLGGRRFEVIRDAVKDAAKRPPLTVKFRIQIEYLPKGAHWQRLLEEAMAGAAEAASAPRGGRRVKGARPAGGAGAGAVAGAGSDLDEEEKQAQPMVETDVIPAGEEEFVSHMTHDQASQLQVGDHIDHRDDVGRYLLAMVVEKHGSRLKIHYEGWNPKWDVYSDYTRELHRFAAPKSISRQPQKKMMHVKVRDYIDINPVHRHPDWRFGQVRRMDKYSGQVQVVYKEGGAEYLYWVHLNNPEEAAPFMSRAEETLRAAKGASGAAADYDAAAPPPPKDRDLPPKPPRKGGGRYTVSGAPPKKTLPPLAGASKKSTGSRPSTAKKWTCSMCGAANDIHHESCIHCGTARVSR